MSLLQRIFNIFYEKTPRHQWRSEMKGAIESGHEEVWAIQRQVRPSGSPLIDIITGDYDPKSPLYKRRGV